MNKHFTKTSLVLVLLFSAITLSQTYAASMPGQADSATINVLDFSKQTAQPDYAKKRRGMLVLGGFGIPTFIIGAGLEIAGGVLYGYALTMDLTWRIIKDSMAGSVPTSMFNLKWIGLGILTIGSFIFLGGLAMTILGFVFAKYYQNKSKKVSMLSQFTEESCRFGLSISL